MRISLEAFGGKNVMEVLRDNEGRYAINPDDCFEHVSLELYDWIKEPIPKELLDGAPEDLQVEQIIHRAGLAGRAIDLYKKASNNNTLDFLRFPPRVIENYVPGLDCQGDTIFWFMFKEDNNGNTYRIFTKDERSNEL
jgi:hypothetical protein